MIHDVFNSFDPTWDVLHGSKGQISYKCIQMSNYIFGSPVWRPFWAIKKIGMMGFLGTFDIMFLISLANYPEKFSLVLFFSRSKPIYPGLILKTKITLYFIKLVKG